MIIGSTFCRQLTFIFTSLSFLYFSYQISEKKAWNPQAFSLVLENVLKQLPFQSLLINTALEIRSDVNTE